MGSYERVSRGQVTGPDLWFRERPLVAPRGDCRETGRMLADQRGPGCGNQDCGTRAGMQAGLA